MTKSLLVDTTLCIGCGSCELACAESNGLPEPDTTAPNKKLDENHLTVVRDFDGYYVRRMCMHCADPTCASVCPVGALRKTETGPVVYDEEKCIGCRYCMAACPFGIPTYEWSKALPYVRKCTMCYQKRVSVGKQTACAEACPTGATIFGERDELLTEADKRVRENTATYVNHIYGKSEVGGTGVLFLSSKPFNEIGFKMDLIQDPVPMLTWNILSKIPSFVCVGAVALSGIWWITNRRAEVAEFENAQRKKSRSAEDLLSVRENKPMADLKEGEKK